MNSNMMNNILEVADVVNSLKERKDIVNFMLEIFTEAELETLSKRWQILKMLKNSVTQREIAQKLQTSLCKVTRGAKILKNKNSVINKYLIERN